MSIPAATPRAVLFDLGGTLLVEKGYDLAAGVRSFLEGSSLRGEALGEDAEGVLAELAQVIDATRSVPAREFSLLRWLCERFQVGEADAALAELAIFLGCADLEPAPGARELLDLLTERGIPFAAVSNAMFSGRTLAFELHRHQLGAPFRFVLSSADCGSRKPHPRIFETALESLGVGRDSIWFVGDTWEADVEGASAAGLEPVWLSAGEAPAALAHRRASGLSELVSWLRAGSP